MTAQELETRIIDHLRQRHDVGALILAGSRAKDGSPDQWSDWDFHLITTTPSFYQNTAWLTSIAPVWAAHAERTPRGVIKVSAIFEGGLEVDFIPLAQWQMKLVYATMRRPHWSPYLPGRLHRGILETRAFMLGSGYRLLIGGDSWQRRLSALDVLWDSPALSVQEFVRHQSAFWQKAVWISKKIMRPEPRSAMHWLHKLITEHLYPLLAEEARIAGRLPRPEARKAEKWLNRQRLEQTAFSTSVDQAALVHTQIEVIALFEEVSRSVAVSRGFAQLDHSAVANWMRAELRAALN